MKVRAVLLVNAALAGAAGIALLVAPAGAIRAAGLEPNTAAVVLAQLLGAGLMGTATMAAFARRVPETDEGFAAIVLGFTVGGFVATAVALFFVLYGGGRRSVLAWIALVVLTAFTTAYGSWRLPPSRD